MKLIYYLVIIIIIIIQNIIIRNMLIKNNHIHENERMLAMNGINCQYYISYAHHYNLFNLFKYLTNILNENNIDYIISCGTLLGYCRHNNGFIPWDDDIDICVVEKDLGKLKELMKEVVKNDEYCFNDSPYGKDTFYQFSLNPVNIKSVISDCNIVIDVFIINNNNNENIYTYYDIVTTYFPNEYYRKDELYPLRGGNFKLYLPNGAVGEEISIKLPNKPHAYLDRSYTDWRTKKVYSPHNIYYKFLFNKLIPYDQFNFSIFTTLIKKIFPYTE